MGRPLKYQSVKRMKEAIDKYFIQCDEENKPYSIEQLARSLGTTRKTLWEYESKDRYGNVIKEAKQRIAGSVEQIMLSGKAQAGCIFWLKNHGWSDKQEIEVNDVTKLTKDELINKIKSLATIVPIKKTAESDKKQAVN